MKLLLACAGLAFAAADDSTKITYTSVVEAAKAKGWEAGLNHKFEGITVDQAKKLMGVRGDPAAKLRLSKWDGVANATIPASFDARTQWPDCPLIGHARDQSACGSCWAFGSTEAFNDRLCIAHNVTAELSAADTAACCNFFGGCPSSSGCDGGEPSDAWNWFVNTGVVTGGDNSAVGSGTSCFPYPFPACEHHVSGPYPPCPANEYPTPQCPSQNSQGCTDSKYPVPWANDAHFATSAYSLDSVEAIQTDIMTRGPVTAAFTVYSDFLSYKSGVYQYTSGDELGGHAIKIVGWGVTDDGNNTPYWIVMNSWNPSWGMNGAFWILRGQDECGIEDDVVAGAV